jgi:hypothetical protein
MGLQAISGNWSQFVEYVEGIYQNIVIKLLVDLFIYAPAGFISVYVTTADIKKEIDIFVGEDVALFLGEHQLSLFFFSIGLIYTLREIVPMLVSKATAPNNQLTLKGSLALIEAFSSIVNVKSARFDDTVKSIKRSAQDYNGEYIFNEITKPEQQILYTIHVLQVFLESILKDVEVDVRLVEVKDKKAHGWYGYAPTKNPPKTHISELRDSDSALAFCAKTSRMVVIPDIRKESKKLLHRKYKMLNPEEVGSVICYPIYHAPSNCHPFVVTIRANKPNLFNPEKKEFYKWLLGQFSQRIQLEYTLSLLKEVQGNE